MNFHKNTLSLFFCGASKLVTDESNVGREGGASVRESGCWWEGQQFKREAQAAKMPDDNTYTFSTWPSLAGGSTS